MSVNASYTLHIDDEDNPDSTDRIEFRRRDDAVYIEVFGRAMHTGSDSGEESVFFTLSDQNFSELTSICNLLVDSDPEMVTQADLINVYGAGSPEAGDS